MSHKKTGGALLAIAAATLFVSGCANQAGGAATTAEVNCQGINACKGTGACKTAANECGGKNACKGQGFVKTTAADCTANGGTVL